MSNLCEGTTCVRTHTINGMYDGIETLVSGNVTPAARVHE
jgi:hypothetical protein